MKWMTKMTERELPEENDYEMIGMEVIGIVVRAGPFTFSFLP